MDYVQYVSGLLYKLVCIIGGNILNTYTVRVLVRNRDWKLLKELSIKVTAEDPKKAYDCAKKIARSQFGDHCIYEITVR